MKQISLSNSQTESTLKIDSLQSIFDSILPHLMNNHSFLEGLHLEAVNLEQKGKFEIAQHLFRIVQKEAENFTELQAWAFFKDGEILLKTGHDEEAQEAFHRALELNPNHTKAMLMLHSPHEPLIILLGHKNQWWHHGINVNFYLNNLELWEYYFKHRLIDQLWISPPRSLINFDWHVMCKLTESYISMNGSIVIALNQDKQLSFSRNELTSIIYSGEMSFRSAMEKFVQKLLM
ncbi:MAG: tetratricopeptide repeat protein [Desulfamplus sp.]|nr:tetratricopeptide repeat protein [Desulfamplus sp.]